jgi:hypothetical protein
MSTSASKKVIYAALAGNALISITKFFAAFLFWQLCDVI